MNDADGPPQSPGIITRRKALSLRHDGSLARIQRWGTVRAHDVRSRLIRVAVV